MSFVLVVPIHIDGLYLPFGATVAGPTINLTNLPWVRRKDGLCAEVSAENPFLSESLQVEPLSIGGNYLASGVHLHWALPSALATGRHPLDKTGKADRDLLVFDDVPDRWLVRRWSGKTPGNAWLVESDYLWAVDEVVEPDVALALSAWPNRIVQADGEPPAFVTEPGAPPWRFLGRKRLLGKAWPPTAKGDSLAGIGRLTAMGFGETNFASFYPNCRSVFGLHDGVPLDTGTWFEVFGWYHALELDPVARSAGEKLRETLLTLYRWDWKEADTPARTLCYGRVLDSGFVPAVERKPHDVVVAIGHTATEAMSALLAKEISDSHPRLTAEGQERQRNRTEDVLDGLCLADRLPAREVDVGDELEIARHDRGFHAAPSSPLYVVRIRWEKQVTAKAEQTADTDLTLPEALAAGLNALNSLQQAYDRERRYLEAARQQLFCDWYRTMLHTNAPDEDRTTATSQRGGLASELDVDDLVGYLGERAHNLNAARRRLGDVLSHDAADNGIRVWRDVPGSARLAPCILRCTLGADGATPVWQDTDGTPWTGASDSTAARLVAQRLSVCAAVDRHNAQVPKDPQQKQEQKQEWELATVPGPRFWEANEPLLVISADGLAAPDRGKTRGTPLQNDDGSLKCSVVTSIAAPWLTTGDQDASAEAAFLTEMTAGPFRDALDRVATACGMDSSDRGTPLPYFLDWKASIAPAWSGSNRRGGVRTDYDPGYVRGNWLLGEGSYEMAFTPAENINRVQQTTAVGRTVIGDHGGSVVRARLETYIVNRLSQPVHRVTVDGGITEKCWFEAQGIPYGERKLHAAALPRMREWAAQMRLTLESDEAGLAARRMQQVVAAAMAPATFARGLRVDGVIENAIYELLTVWPGEDLAELSAEQVTLLKPGPHTLARFDAVLGTGAANAPVFCRLLQGAERRGKFGVSGLQYFPLVHGVPDRGGLAAAMVRIASSLSGEDLLNKVKLSTGAVAGILRARESGPLHGLLGLAAIPGVGAGAFGLLLDYAAQQNQFPPLPPPIDEEWRDEAGRHGVGALVEALEAWERLESRGPTLAQSLDGMHDAFLMRRRGWQLPVADPMGFVDYRIFYENKVRDAVGGHIQIAPAVMNPFVPLYNGELELMDLWLIDVFGQTQQLSVKNHVPARTMRRPGTERTHLLPRLLQAARLNLRWLDAAQRAEGDAEGSHQEWNSHPASSPVCGWVVADRVDGSLLFFDSAGAALGSLNRKAEWDVAPGASAPVTPRDIDNGALRAVVVELESHKAAGERAAGERTPIEQFIELMESALESIDPAAVDSEDARALLFSRPVVVTQIAASFELAGPPAKRQGLYDLAQDIRGEGSRSDGLESLLLPLRIGEHQRLHDGVVGYWIADGKGRIADSTFHTPQTAWAGAGHGPGASGRAPGVYRDADSTSIHWLRVDQKIRAIVLSDPRGVLHGTSGILPPKRISLPPDQYLPAIARLRLVLVTAPVLTPAGDMQIPLRAEPGWDWMWVAREGTGVARVPSRPLIRQDAFAKAFPASRGLDAMSLWGRLIAAGVLEPLPADAKQAAVHYDKLQDAFAVSHSEGEGIPEDLQADVRRVIEIAGRRLASPPGNADFTTRQLREGWLCLTKQGDSNV